MNRIPLSMTSDLLHAYVDGQLPAAQVAEVEAYLANSPEAQALVEGWRRQNEAISAIFAPVAGEAVPPRLSVRQIDRNVTSHRAHRLRNWAAAIVLVLIGSAVGWTGRDYLTPVEAAPDRLIEEAVNAHTLYVREKTHAVEVPAGAPNLMTWLSNRIAVAFDAPDLSAHGYRFIGGRLLPGYGEGAAQGPAAQLMYENDSSQRLTLYVTAPLPDKKEVWEFKTIGTAEAYYWANDAVTCTIVASLPEAEVRLLGKAVFEQLTRRPDSTWNRDG